MSTLSQDDDDEITIEEFERMLEQLFREMFAPLPLPDQRKSE